MPHTRTCNCGCRSTNIHPRTRFRHLRKISDAADAAAAVATTVTNLNTESELDNQGKDVPMELDDGNGRDLAQANEEIGRDEGTNVNTHESYRDYESEDARSEAASSEYSWFDVGTPLPTPPQSPLPQSDNGESSEDEDGYTNLTHEDYREYDRWYAEDSQTELDEMLVETLTKKEMDSIKLMAIRQFGHISQRNYERIRYSFRNKIRLLTLQCLGTRIAALSGIKPENHDCCVNICHAFTEQFAQETVCSKCGQPRYDSRGRPRQTYQYIPRIPRLQALFNNPEIVEKLLYRHNYAEIDGAMDDFFDSELYHRLRQQNIVIDGEDTGIKYFSGKYDLATSVLSDGVQIFQHSCRENSTCWPVLMQILNLPPVYRVQLRNLVPLAVIPGPNQPKDFNSFLAPFVKESLILARGVETYNALTGRNFILREHPVIVSGDMQAIKHLEEMKGPNAKVPCRGCESVGVYHSLKRTYYIPLAQPLDSDNPAATTSSYDPLNLPLRTEQALLDQLGQMERAKTQSKREKLAMKFGIAGHSILDRIPSIQRPTSYPHEFLHLFLLNHLAELVSLWTNTFPGISDSGCENYLISARDWAAIGRETEAATKLLPSAFIRPLPNIQTSRHLFCGESWSFWLLYIGPIVLRGRLAKKYYNHFLELVSIVKCVLELSNTTDRIKQLREEIAEYVQRFEEYYYQYNYDRVCVCRLTLHALLHVADDILRCGPMWVSWSFSIERYCREVTACAKSKVVPYATIDKHVLQMAQLAAVASRFAEIRKALLFGKADAPVDVSRMECIYPGYPHTILRCPRLRGFLLKDTVRRRLAAYFHTNNPQRTFHEWLTFLPERCERWGKVRIRDGGDCIRSASATNPLSVYGKRDSSFVRYTYFKDKNEKRRNLPVELVPAIGYGRLDFILALVLPSDPDFNIDEPQPHILAHLTEAKGADGDATTELVSYTQLGRSFILDVTAIENVVGRVETRGVKASGEWIIVDRSNTLSRTVFQQEEVEFEEDAD